MVARIQVQLQCCNYYLGSWLDYFPFYGIGAGIDFVQAFGFATFIREYFGRDWRCNSGVFRCINRFASEMLAELSVLISKHYPAQRGSNSLEIPELLDFRHPFALVCLHKERIVKNGQ